MLAAGLLEIRRLRGVNRPAIAVVLPTRPGPSVLIDSGANADGAAGAPASSSRTWAPSSRRRSSASAIPRCACSRSARSPRREPADARGAPRCWPRQTTSTSRGNTESRNLLEGAADVVVCDGFTGNVVLKALEGTIRQCPRRPARGDQRQPPGQARRPPDPSGRAQPSRSARPRYLRRRVPARPARAGRDRARKLRPRGRSRTRFGSPRAGSSTTSSDSLQERLEQSVLASARSDPEPAR